MTTKRANINKSQIEKMNIGDVIWDTLLPGFGVRRQKNKKAFVLKKYYNGKQRWFTLGSFDEGMTVKKARGKAEVLLGKIADGKDPAQDRDDMKNRATIKELCERFLTDYAEEHKKPSSIRMDRKNIDNHIVPLLGYRFVEDITVDDIDRFKRSVKDGKTAKPLPEGNRGGSAIKGGSGAANRCLALLSKAFNLSIRWGWRQTNPVQHVQKYKEKKIERFLSEAEFVELASAIKTEEEKETSNPYAIAAIRLLIFTGARRSEILTLKWDEVDFVRRVIVLSDSKTGSKVIYLNPPALELLTSLERQKDNPYVICGIKPRSHLYDVNRAWRNIRMQASLTDLRLHDLRHSFASIAVGGGMSLPMIGKLLGHSQVATTARYAHLADDPLREANNAIGNKLIGLMGGDQPTNITELGKNK